jgi:hypothetical protein
MKYFNIIMLTLFAGCAQQVPLSELRLDGNGSQGSTLSGDLISDLTLHTSKANEIQYEKPILYTFQSPIEAFQYLILRGGTASPFQIGLLKDLTSQITWLNSLSPDRKNCVINQSKSLQPSPLQGASEHDVQVGTLSQDVSVICDLSEQGQESPLVLFNNVLYSEQVFVPLAAEAAIDESLNSMVINILGESLLFHMDDRNTPALAVIDRHIEEPLPSGNTQQPKKLRTTFSLKLLHAESKALFDSGDMISQEISADPIQNECSVVAVDWDGDQIFVSFRRVSSPLSTHLGNLCGVYFERSKKLYAIDEALSASLDI